MKLLNDFFHIAKHTRQAETDVFSVELNATHTIYQAHFPGNPITPGVCLIQIATECLQEKLGKRLYLKNVKNIKFLSVLSPADTIHADFVFPKIDVTDVECKVQVSVLSGDTHYAKISMSYVYESF